MTEILRERQSGKRVVVGRAGEVLITALQDMLTAGEIKRFRFMSRVEDTAFNIAGVREKGISKDNWRKRMKQAERIAEDIEKRVFGEQKANG